MRERWRRTVLGCLCVLLAACGGGSGSTGLITSEDAVIDDVRRNGTCGEFDGAPYCASDSPNAVAPGGQSVSVVALTPTPTRTPIAGGATATPVVGATSTPAGGPASTPTAVVSAPASPRASATPSPAPSASPSDERTVTATVTGFEAGAACAVAARSAGSADVWQTAALVALDAAGAAVVFPLPGGVVEPLEVVLLCFADPPATLPAELVTLADADPTVVFVLPDS